MGRSRTSLERPDSLRPYELLLPRDAQTALCGRGPGGKPVSPARVRRGYWGDHERPPPYPSPQGGGTAMGRSGTSLERPDSLRPYELLLPRDAQTALCGRGPGGNPVSPARFEGATGVTTRDPLPN